jgi:hypothetical protein
MKPCLPPQRRLRVSRFTALALAVAFTSGSSFASLSGPTDSADGYWIDQTATTLDGVDAAEGRVDGMGASETWLATTVTGPTTLYYSYRVKNFTGPYSGRFALVVGETTTLISPATAADQDTGWREAQAVIPEGSHTVRWSLYYNRGSSPVRAWLDQVWTASDARPRVTPGTVPHGTLDTPYSWSVPKTSTSPATLSASGLPPGLTADPDSFTISGTPTAAGFFEATLTAHNTAGQHISKVLFHIEPGTTSLGEALDNTTLEFSASGAPAAWVGATGLGHDGMDAARGVVGPDGERTHQLTTTFQGPGTLRFWYRTDERGRGAPISRLNLYIGDHGSLGEFSETEWTQATVQIPPGPVQSFSWEGVTVTGSQDFEAPLYVYLDKVEFTPGSVPPQSTYEAWKWAWNVYAQPITTDDDGDGLTLLMEYATGGSPYKANPELLPVTSIVDDYFHFHFTKASSPTDLLYLVQGTQDLAPNSWTTSSVEVIDEDGTHLEAQSKKPVSAQPAFQMRVRVLLAP